MPERLFNQVTDGRYGPFLYNRNDRYVGRSMDVYGECCELELELLRQLCRPGGTAFDVGANAGTHTVPLAKHVGESGFVYAFEPQRVVFQTLCANVALNSLLNVECVHAAVGAAPGTVLIPDLDYNAPANYGGISPKLFESGRPVRQIVLDDYCGLPAVDLVKIDVEGMELDVLQGAARFIERFRPLMYVENDRVDRSEALIRALGDAGYRLFWHLPPLFNPANVRGVTEDVFGGIVAANMLCVPRERAVSIQGFDEIVDPAFHPFGRPL
jgi:FkbM family methyltransferase